MASLSVCSRSSSERSASSILIPAASARSRVTMLSERPCAIAACTWLHVLSASRSAGYASFARSSCRSFAAARCCSSAFRTASAAWRNVSRRSSFGHAVVRRTSLALRCTSAGEPKSSSPQWTPSTCTSTTMRPARSARAAAFARASAMLLGERPVSISSRSTRMGDLG